jgi:outer membrane protein assembly factor BamE (lipoprotein component of BamABCDE complex)
MSCATGSSSIITGKDFDATYVDKVQKGKTARDELLTLYGQPYGKSFQGSTETWTYMYLRSEGYASVACGSGNVTGQSYQKNLTVQFDSSGIAQSVNYSVSGDPNIYKK